MRATRNTSPRDYDMRFSAADAGALHAMTGEAARIWPLYFEVMTLRL